MADAVAAAAAGSIDDDVIENTAVKAASSTDDESDQAVTLFERTAIAETTGPILSASQLGRRRASELAPPSSTPQKITRVFCKEML